MSNIRKILSLIFYSLLIYSTGCNTNIKVLHYSNFVSDSILMEFNSGNGFVRPTILNDSQIFVYDKYEENISFFKCSKPNVFNKIRTIQFKPNDPKPNFNFLCLFEERLYYVDKENKFYYLDLDSEKITKVDKLFNNNLLNGYFLYLIDDFHFNFNGLDTIIAPIGYHWYPNLDSLKSLSSKSIFANLVISDTSITFLNEFFERHPELLKSSSIYPKYTYNKFENLIVVIYPHFDEIHTYNLFTREKKVSQIRNKFYTKPQECDTSFNEIGRDAALKKIISSFEYLDICYNPKTNHYLVTFNLPAVNEAEWIQKSPMGIILNSNFEIIHYVEMQNNYNLMKGKYLSKYLYGCLINVGTDNEKYEKYYILNF